MANRARSMFLVGLLAFCLPAVLVSVRAQDEPASCEVEISAEFVGQYDFGDGQKLQFEVEIATPARCAVIEYDLIIEENQPNNQVHRVRKTQVTRLRDGELTQVVDHVLKPGYTMLGHEVRSVSCTPCDTGEAMPEP